MFGGIIKLDDELHRLVSAGNEHVRVGAGMLWTLFDNQGRLLLRKGALIESEAHLRELLDNAVFRTSGELSNPSEPSAARTEKEPRKTAFFVIGELMARLNTILYNIAIRRGDDAARRVNELAIAIQVLCAQDSDAALAAIHLDHDGRYIVRHPIHSALLVELVTYRLGYAPNHRKNFIAAALTANVGMLDLQERLQRQGPVTPSQREEINQHSEQSVELLRQAGVNNETWLEIVLQHHERMDGSGYPKGLRGEQIHQGARAIALADIYHAKISERTNRPPMLPTHALRQVFLGQGNDVDRVMAKVFIKELGVYPPGAFVRLFNGELAVVTHRGLDGVVPRVASVISPRGAAYPRPLSRETNNREYAVKETAGRDESVLITELLPLWGY